MGDTMLVGHTIFSRFFTQYVFDDLLKNKEQSIFSEIAKRYVEKPYQKSNYDVIHEIYKTMSKRYRNEYFYQNTLLNKLLIGKHSLNTSTALTQVTISKSKADFILINGKAVVYEIKSDLDSLDRLEKQISNYYKAFTHVCIVTNEENYIGLSDSLKNSPVGIYVLTSNNTISQKMCKEPEKQEACLQHESLFKLLHKSEYEKILSFYYASLPDSAPVFYYNDCFFLFCKIPITEAYKLVTSELKLRKRECSEFIKVPYELRSLTYFSKNMSKNVTLLETFLNKQFGG